jgi:hypothetical protein
MTRTEPSKAQHLYQLWATGCGASPSIGLAKPAWDNLDGMDKKRWAMLAAAVGDITHQHHFRTVKDSERYGSIPTDLDYADYDKVLSDQDRDHLGYKVAYPGSRRIPDEVDTFAEWKQKRLEATRQRWWQFWRLPEVDVSENTYWDYVQHATGEVHHPTLKDFMKL